MLFNDINKKYPKAIDDLPEKQFFAILTPQSTFVPGDERSKTNPGHGYPEHTVYSWNMEVFQNEEEWKEEIKDKHKRNIRFKAIRAIPAQIEVSVNVEIK